MIWYRSDIVSVNKIDGESILSVTKIGKSELLMMNMFDLRTIALIIFGQNRNLT